MRFCVRAESPLHVGTGESLAWLDYALAGRTVHVFDWGRIMDTALMGREDAGDRLAEFTDRCARVLKRSQDALMKAPGNQRSEILREVREETSPIGFAQQELSNEVLARAMRAGDYDRYACEFLGGRLDRRLEIRCQAKDRSGNPVIPASTLRGQLRTALAHATLSTGDEATARRILEGGDGLDGWNRGLAQATPGRARFLFGDEIEAAALRPLAGRQRHPLRSDPRVDLMRFLRVSDPLCSKARLVVLRSSPFGLASGRGNQSPHIMPLQPSVMEAIETGSQFEFELEVDVRTLRGVALATGSAHPMVRDDFWQLFGRVFGLSRDEVKTLDDESIENRVLSAVEVSLSGRMMALIQRETAWLERMSAPKDAPLRVFAERIVQQPGGRLPLRIGMGSGLHSMTVLPSIEADPLLSEPLARVLARAGLGLKPRDRRMRSENEKAVIERARRAVGGKSGGAASLREDLLSQKCDLAALPRSRRLTMVGGVPGEYLGFASLIRGVMTDEEPVDRAKQAQDLEAQRTAERTAARSVERAPKRSSKPKPPRRPAVPDRPANESEITDLLKKFGPRH